MAIRPIIKAPDPVLKRKCLPVEKVDSHLRQLMDDMLETMYAAPGVGLAAPQVGVHKRVIVVDVSDPTGEEREPLRMANPEIIEASEDIVLREEGCLSFPEHYAEVERPATVRVRYLDQDNEIREIDAEGLLSVCVQHEMDHLDGVLFVDHLSSLKRNIIVRKMTKLKRAKATAGV
jgi:peptide deformylase